MEKKRPTPFLCLLLYGLAIVTLFTALWMLFTALKFNQTAAPRMEEMLAAFGSGASVLAELLNNAVAILGLVFAGLALTISALLFTAAQLLIQTTRLSDRITILEDQLKLSESTPEEA